MEPINYYLFLIIARIRKVTWLALGRHIGSTWQVWVSSWDLSIKNTCFRDTHCHSSLLWKWKTLTTYHLGDTVRSQLPSGWYSHHWSLWFRLQLLPMGLATAIRRSLWRYVYGNWGAFQLSPISLDYQPDYMTFRRRKEHKWVCWDRISVQQEWGGSSSFK